MSSKIPDKIRFSRLKAVVIADSYQDYLKYLKETSYDRREYKYIKDLRDLASLVQEIDVFQMMNRLTGETGLYIVRMWPWSSSHNLVKSVLFDKLSAVFTVVPYGIPNYSCSSMFTCGQVILASSSNICTVTLCLIS